MLKLVVIASEKRGWASIKECACITENRGICAGILENGSQFVQSWTDDCLNSFERFSYFIDSKADLENEYTIRLRTLVRELDGLFRNLDAFTSTYCSKNVWQLLDSVSNKCALHVNDIRVSSRNWTMYDIVHRDIDNNNTSNEG